MTEDTMIAALLRERAGYVTHGMHDRAAQVDEQLALRGYTPPNDETAETETPSTPPTGAAETETPSTPPTGAAETEARSTPPKSRRQRGTETA
jgi:hypothetical protein